MLRIRFQATRLSVILIYVAVIAGALALAYDRVNYPTEAAPSVASREPTVVESTAPYFSLATNRTFGTQENPRLWLDYRAVNSLDFRVYRVNDPAKFFAQLSNPHQMGEQEEEQIATTISRSPSLLERLRSVKRWAYSGVRSYFREQLKTDTRASFNQKFRADDAPRRTPLNVADYARVPLLNPNQLVTSWREPLPSLENIYDRRMVPLGKREPGVYLVEAVSENLRAYTIVVVTDLAMVEKSSPNGELVVFAVDRRSGEPRPDTQVEIVKAKQTIAAGRTNAEGVFRTKILQKTPDEELGELEIPEVDNNSFVILASHKENFAISDLESFYFNENVEPQIQGYIYTDRPIYRPTHQVFFKGILRGVDEQGSYRSLKSQTVTVTVKDSNDARIYEQELRLSSRGTFHGELTLGEDVPLGAYQIEAQTDEGGSTGSFEVAEYKKPEYKVNVTTPQRFVPAGEKSKFEINARYFFGAPVTNADVKYYIYRSRYYPSYWETDDPEPEADDEIDDSAYGSYYSDMVAEGEGKLDASGRLEIPFDVPVTNDNDVWDFQYRIEAQITDASRRSINGSANLVATRGSVIARATSDRYVYTPGQTANVRVSTTDYEGRPVSAKVGLQFVLRTHEKVEKKENEYDPDYVEREVELASTEVTTDKEGYATYSFPITALGNISIKSVVEHAGKRYTSLGGSLWVADDEQQWADGCMGYYAQSSIKLVADKKSYRAGETAHVLALLPIEGANLLVTTELDTVKSAKRVYVPGRSTVLDVPIESSYAPNVFVSVTFVKDGDMFTEDRRLVVPARDKLLDLEIIPNKPEYKPRETASYTILARDADGAPVRDAEVSVGVIDEAIYSLSP
ncbi:MAG TPA: MG2 domain-containing protein, partial [Pyrinomonadaceae bacterium]|nr:MG2 domain-containing protein [Pyrinomonadaceae bacterium]